MKDSHQNKNVAELLRRRLPAHILAVVRKIGTIAQERGISAYIVGGFVRDLLLGVDNLDLDIVVEADAITFSQVLESRIDLAVLRHRRFATATVTLSGGFKIDIASARKEYYAHPAALPEVQFSSIREDLFRRDFTINTLAVNINRENFGEILDPFAGRQDLEAKKLRVLHERSFIDDPTRIFRAVRFEQRFNFAIDKHTEQLIRQAKRKGALERLSNFRRGSEIILILKEPQPLRSLLRLSKLCGPKVIHPAIELNKGRIALLQTAQAAIKAIGSSRLRQAFDGWLVYFIILSFRLTLAELRNLCRQFALTKAQQKKIETFKKDSASVLKTLERKPALAPHKIYQILSRFCLEGTLALLCLAKSRRAKERMGLFLHNLSLINLELTGKDLRRLGLKPGPRYKEILQEVFAARIDGKLNSKVDELTYAKRLISKKVESSR